MTRFALTGMCIAAAVASLSAPAMAQKLAAHPAVFKAERGVTVTVAPTADDKGALVRVQGVNTLIDGVVFMTDKVVNGTRLSYRATLDGSPWNIVVNENMQTWGGNYNSTVAYLPPDLRDGTALQYDEKQSKALDLAALTSTYQKQKTDGVQARLGQFNRKNYVANTEEKLAESDGGASKACGLPVKTTVDWSTITEDHMKRLSIRGYCDTVSSSLRSLCTTDSAFKANAAKFANITCQFGQKLNLKQDGGKTVFTTDEKSPNQDDFAVQYLRNQ